MKGAKITLPNSKRFALIPRSASYAIIWQAIPEYLRIPGDNWHPIKATTNNIGSPLEVDEPADGLCCLVRDPIERFRSACARQKVTPEEGLQRLQTDVHFWPISDMGLLVDGVTYFRFPYEIDACANWLGLQTPVPKLNEEPESEKPTLTEQQKLAIQIAFADDIAMWEFISNK